MLSQRLQAAVKARLLLGIENLICHHLQARKERRSSPTMRVQHVTGTIPRSGLLLMHSDSTAWLAGLLVRPCITGQIWVSG